MNPGDAVKACGDFGVKRMCLSISLLASVFRLHVIVSNPKSFNIRFRFKQTFHRSNAVSL